ncbi:response regulator [Paraflavisolibacter sp. H34]|uniref:response regulator n=1 Tax=Huijunlia imazamoxiresistens TaxID=3127457 RepID=UPI0030162B69
MNVFKRNLLAGYGLSLFLLVISAVASYISIRNLLYHATMVNHTNEVIKQLDAVLASVREGETGQRGYLLTGDEKFLAPYRGAYNRARETQRDLVALTTDNLRQQRDIETMKGLVDERFVILQSVIDHKLRTGKLSTEDLEKGRSTMQRLASLVKQMQQREQALLTARTESMNRFAAATPAFIIVAALLSVLVTVVSFLRVNRDFKARLALQKQLELKDREVSRRIDVIQGIAEKISSGDYKTRVNVEHNDLLGTMAGSLNKMAESLDYSFASLSEKEWLQTGAATLNDEMIGDKDVPTLAQNILDFITGYSGSLAGAFYVQNDEEQLQLVGSYGLPAGVRKQRLQIGEGLAGQCAASGRMMEVSGLSDRDFVVSFAAGDVRPHSIIAIPVLFNRAVKGVIELASLNGYSATVRTFLKTVSFNTGIALNTAQDRRRVQELLEETQAQAEELQAQHSELENSNAELEAQAEKLQASEEELKVQQEELLQANQELVERSRMLEEKTGLVLERNLEIQRQSEELRLSSKYKSEFLANMSHELRTPLNSVLLLSRLLSENHEGNLSEGQVEYAQVIQKSGRGLLLLIDEILDLSRIEAGKMEVEAGEVPVDTLAADLRGLFLPLAMEKGVVFSVEKAAGAPGLLQTDRMKVEQILRNLISNALKFTRQGSVVLHIAAREQGIAFTVKDTGIGIPREKQQSIFEAFQQADGSTRRQYGGTGLGLSISRQLARLLGGEIYLASEEGRGSEFTLVLPLQAPKAAAPLPEVPLAVPAADGQFLAGQIPAPVPDDRDNITNGDRVILVIEDDTAFAQALLEYTRGKGYKGLVAVRGDEGIELARRFLPAGILLDLQLPVKSGWEVMEALKSDKATRPIPVHMMSVHEMKTKCLSKGAVDFLNKPASPGQMDEMFRKIEEVLSRHPKKVLIVEENLQHAQALAYFLENHQVSAEIEKSVGEGIRSLDRSGVDCVILDMGIPAHLSYEVLEEVKRTPGYEHLPVIIFTGKNLSPAEELRIKQYADSIVVKTAHSYQRILDEVSLFLHLVEEHQTGAKTTRYKKLGDLGEVLQGKTVLVADDDVRNIFSLTKSLEPYGVEVVSAIDGQHALKLLEENPQVNLVLMDMMMPELDGYEATRRIRENPGYRDLPIIAVTAKAMTGDREKCINAGASDYITKPVDVDQLISLLRVWLYS